MVLYSIEKISCFHRSKPWNKSYLNIISSRLNNSALVTADQQILQISAFYRHILSFKPPPYFCTQQRRRAEQRHTRGEPDRECLGARRMVFLIADASNHCIKILTIKGMSDTFLNWDTLFWFIFITYLFPWNLW